MGSALSAKHDGNASSRERRSAGDSSRSGRRAEPVFRIVKSWLAGEIASQPALNRSRQASGDKALLEVFVMLASDRSAAEEDVDDLPRMFN